MPSLSNGCVAAGTLAVVYFTICCARIDTGESVASPVTSGRLTTTAISSAGANTYTRFGFGTATRAREMFPHHRLTSARDACGATPRLAFSRRDITSYAV